MPLMGKCTGQLQRASIKEASTRYGEHVVFIILTIIQCKGKAPSTKVAAQACKAGDHIRKWEAAEALLHGRQVTGTLLKTTYRIHKIRSTKVQSR